MEVLAAEHEFELGVGLQMQMLDMYYDAGMLKEAQEALQRGLAIAPDVVVQSTKILKVAHLMVSNNQLDGEAFSSPVQFNMEKLLKFCRS